MYGPGGRLISSRNAVETYTSMDYDTLGRVIRTYTGLSDTGSERALVQSTEYDNGSVGDGNVTKVTLHPSGKPVPETGEEANRVTRNWFDWRDRLVATEAGSEGGDGNTNRPLTVLTLDNLGRAVTTSIYDGDGIAPVASAAGGWEIASASASALRARSTTQYDQRGRVFATTQFVGWVYAPTIAIIANTTGGCVHAPYELSDH